MHHFYFGKSVGWLTNYYNNQLTGEMTQPMFSPNGTSFCMLSNASSSCVQLLFRLSLNGPLVIGVCLLALPDLLKYGETYSQSSSICKLLHFTPSSQSDIPKTTLLSSILSMCDIWDRPCVIVPKADTGLNIFCESNFFRLKLTLHPFPGSVSNLI
jgi:hypothetical protein